MVLMQVCFLHLHGQWDPKEPQAENLMPSGLRLGGPKGWRKQCGHLLEHLPSLQTDSKDTMSLIGR